MIAMRIPTLTVILALASVAPVWAAIKVEVRAEVVDLTDVVLSEIQLGSDFRLKVYVKDIRPETPLQGLFSAYVDATFNPALAAVGGPVDVNPFFDLLPTQSTAPGFVSGGGITTNAVLENLQYDRLLYSAPLHATQTGLLSFTLAMSVSADPNVEWLLHGDDGPPLTIDEITFLGLDVPVVPEPSTILLGLPALAAVWALAIRRRVRRKTARAGPRNPPHPGPTSLY